MDPSHELASGQSEGLPVIQKSKRFLSNVPGHEGMILVYISN
ncbi:MAG: hypothetical protein ACTSVI_15200 [Promethearchaeota archaeon]